MKKLTMTPWTAAAVVIALSLVCFQATLGAAGDDGRRSVEADIGVVAADEERCSRIGVAILRQGGNAVDAVVGTALCQGVVNPAASGIGGGGFLLLRLRNGTAEAYDMRETAPAAASEALYTSNPGLLIEGALSVGVPGEVAGLHLAWQRHGKLPWKRLVEPAAKLARDGFVVARYLASQLQSFQEQILSNPELSKIFAPRGKVLVAGETCVREALGKTLAKMARLGPGVLYNGSVGAGLVRDVQAAGGILTLQDLQNYRVRVREPVRADAFGLTVLGMPPPSAGGACTALILHILAGYNESIRGEGVSGAVGLHRTVEAFKHCYAVRTKLGDPDFVNVTGVLADMLSPSFAAELGSTIDDKRTFGPEHYGGRWTEPNEHGTSHMSIVDGERNAVSMTTTINNPFGALLVSPSTGILLNDELGDFSIAANASTPPAAPANRIAPNKRPLSSMSPTVILDQEGQLKGVVGGSGGIRIITTVAQVLLNYFVKGMEASQAVARPRVHHQWLPNVLQFENLTAVGGEHFEVRRSLLEAMLRRGHVLEGIPSGSAVAQLVVVQQPRAGHGLGNGNRQRLVGVSDGRKDGYPAGY